MARVVSLHNVSGAIHNMSEVDKAAAAAGDAAAKAVIAAGGSSEEAGQAADQARAAGVTAAEQAGLSHAVGSAWTAPPATAPPAAAPAAPTAAASLANLTAIASGAQPVQQAGMLPGLSSLTKPQKELLIGLAAVAGLLLFVSSLKNRPRF